MIYSKVDGDSMSLQKAAHCNMDLGMEERGDRPYEVHGLPPSKAINALMRHFDDNPDDAVAINDMGVLHTRMGHNVAALDCYKKAHRLSPDNSNIAKNLADLLFVAFGDLPGAMELYLGVLRQTPDDCDSLLAAGHISAAIDQIDDARDFYARVCEIEPEHCQAAAALADIDEGRPAVPAASVADADVAETYETLLASHPGETILAELMRFADRHPHFAPVRNDIGVILSQTDDAARAETYFRQSVELDPVNKTFLKNLGDYLLVRQQRLVGAAEAYLQVLKLDVFDVEALYALALISRSSGDEESALVFLDRVGEIDPLYLQDAEPPSPADANAPLTEPGGAYFEPPVADLRPRTAVAAATDQPCRLAPKKKALNKLSVYLIVGEEEAQIGGAQAGGELVEKRVAAFAKRGVCRDLYLLTSKAWTRSHPTAAESVRNTVGEDHFIEAPAQPLSAVLSQRLSSDPNDYYAILRDDVWVADSGMAQLVSHLAVNDRTAVVGPLANYATGVQHADLSIDTTFDGFEKAANHWLKSHRYRRIESGFLNDGCVLLSNKAMAQVGALDRDLPRLKDAIGDWCLRARLAGLQVLIAGDTLAFRPSHPPGAGQDRSAMAQKCNRLFRSDREFKKALLDLQSKDEFRKIYQSEGLAAALDAASGDDEIGDLSTALLADLVEISIDAGQFEAATRFLEPLCQKSDDGFHLALAGLVHHGLGAPDRAEALALKALQKTPQLPEALNLRGMIAFGRQASDEAESFFRQAIEADPGFGDPYANLATVMWAADQERAFELYATAFKLCPHKTDIAELFQMATAQLGRQEAAIPSVLEAIRRYPQVRLLRSLAIEAYLQLGDLNAAMTHVTDVLCQFPLEAGFLDAALKIRKQLGPLAPADKPGATPSLALCMIVKDEAAHIAKCLSSTTGLVDEIILVDTGSTDATREIAAVMGAKVVQHEWQDSFADARNVYMRAAHSDWILVLDADEVIARKDHQPIRDLISAKDAAACAYTITTRNYDTNPTIIGWTANTGEYPQEERGNGWVPTDKVRLFPNDDRLYYSFPVHEMIEPALQKHDYHLRKTDVPVHHYGKLDADKTRKKHDVYYHLGLQKLAETGDNAYALRELAIQAGLLEKYDEAIDLWNRFLAIKPHIPEAYINLGTAYFHLADFHKAHESAKRGYEIAPHFRESLYNYALMSLHIGELDIAMTLGRQLADDNPDYLPGVFFYVCACFAGGELETGNRYLQTLKHTSFGPVLSKSFETFCKGLSDAGQHGFVRKIEAAIRHGSDAGLSAR
jgi:tetratricopeptide (TPR) repeat protein